MNAYVTRFALRWFLIGVALLLSLAGCSNVPTTVETSTPSPVSLVPSLTPSPRVTPPVTSTPSRSVATLSPIVVTRVPTRTPTTIPTPLAPLTEEEARAFVIHMQETNGGCELPCWWGITPGKTKGREAEQILSPLRKFGEGDTVGALSLYFLELHVYANQGLVVRVDTKTSKNQPVDRIYVESFITVKDDTARYDESWRRYFVNELLTRLGPPSDVWLGFGPSGSQESQRYRYELMVFYEDLGATVGFAGLEVRGNVNRA